MARGRRGYTTTTRAAKESSARIGSKVEPLRSALFILNYPEFPDSWLWAKLSLLVNIRQVLVDRPNILLVQFGNERLREPQRLILETALNARLAIPGLIQNNG